MFKYGLQVKYNLIYFSVKSYVGNPQGGLSTLQKNFEIWCGQDIPCACCVTKSGLQKVAKEVWEGGSVLSEVAKTSKQVRQSGGKDKKAFVEIIT